MKPQKIKNNKSRERKEFYYAFVDLYLGVILLMLNLYFFMFVNNIYDYAPNITFGFITIPFGLFYIIKGFNNLK